MALTLKNYQAKALEALEIFFEAARGATTFPALESAFADARRNALGESAPRVLYRPLSNQWPTVPQVCVRIPTGGGKTLLAAHAIERAARLYVGTPAPLALWLVPSNTIRTQTLEALKTPGHPYREALLAHFPADGLSVIDIADCEQLRAQDFTSRAIVVVGTIQTLRVESTTGREVYAHKENFEPHFATVGHADFLEKIEQKDLDAQPYLGRGDVGKVKYSFANLLAWYRPIVIIDEAHNNTSKLSVEVLNRIRPACVIEWTATPAPDQNVLYHVSASELKAEDMVKLPIVLSPHPNWREAVRDAVLTRQRLAAEAPKESDYVRPIVLFQAENIGGEATVEVMKQYLIADLTIDTRRIAVATGNQRELDGVNLFDPACLIDFVITVKALKEGWDCSFAYVFCTAQKIGSATDMEQLLGRVLRLPYARPRTSPLLERAYAHVCSPDTAQVANQLADRLVAMGFEEMEAAQFVLPQQDDWFADAPHIAPVASSTFELAASVATALQQAAPDAVKITPPSERPDGVANIVSRTAVVVTGVLSPEAIDVALQAAKASDKPVLEALLLRHQVRAQAAASPAQRGLQLDPLPQLCLMLEGQPVLYEPELLAELSTFTLAGAPADLPGFSIGEDEKPYLIDVEQGRLRIEQDRVGYSLNLALADDGIRRDDVIRALDRRVRESDVVQAEMVAWLGRAIDGLQAQGITLTSMARHLNRLADALGKRIRALLLEARKQTLQASLFGSAPKACLDDHYQFRFDPQQYPARWQYEGRYAFQKHFYALPGELNSDNEAEETRCAIELDRLRDVRFWVRNLERQEKSSFWLPTSKDRFYPDFVAQLCDGRMMVVEYKGAHLFGAPDAREKNDIGQAWAVRSDGRCIFIMVTDEATAGAPIAVQLQRALEADRHKRADV